MTFDATIFRIIETVQMELLIDNVRLLDEIGR